MSVLFQLPLFKKCHQVRTLMVSFHKSSSTINRKFPVDDENGDLPVFEYATPGASHRRVFAWGVAETGALGNYTKKTRKQMRKLAEFYHHPKRLYFSGLYKVLDIACGYGFTLFHTEPDSKGIKVFGCGINTDSQIGYHVVRKDNPLAVLLNPGPIEIPFRNPQTKVKGLAAGRAHTLVLTDLEGVYTLGNNAYGQCGRPVIQDEKYCGSQIVHQIKDLDGAQIRSVACGQDHSMFITKKGEVFACGWNADGQTGQQHYESHWTPKQVTGDIVGEDIVKLSCSGDCILALNCNGEVFGWGNSEYGQLGSDSLQMSTSKHLSFLQSLGKIVDVAAGGSFCMVLNEQGKVYVWGYGILGKGPEVQRSLTPTEIPEILFGKNEFQPDSKVLQISCGLHHLMAVTNQGSLFAWGHNRGGCLGLGHDHDQFFPLKVNFAGEVIKICCGVDHTVALCRAA